MAKYHINKKGEARACTATVGPCPLGSSEDHYSTPEAAREAYETAQVRPITSHSRSSADPLPGFSMSPDDLYAARIRRRVAGAMAPDGRSEHWNVVPDREVRATIEGLVSEMKDEDSSRRVAEALKAMRKAGRVDAVMGSEESFRLQAQAVMGSKGLSLADEVFTNG